MNDNLDEIRNCKGELGQIFIIEINGNFVGDLCYRIKNDGTVYPGWKICDFAYQNQGYGPQIIKLLFEFLFLDENINSKFLIDTIIWDTMLENKRAQYVYEHKIKARKIGIKEKSWQDQLGNWRGSVDYKIR